MITFNHFNFNVLDLDKSLAFYRDALDLKVVRENHKEAFFLVFLGDGVTGFSLELTYLKDRTEPYNLGEKEYHLAFVTDDYEALHKKHQEMGCICYENPSMGHLLYRRSGRLLDRNRPGPPGIGSLSLKKSPAPAQLDGSGFFHSYSTMQRRYFSGVQLSFRPCGSN